MISSNPTEAEKTQYALWLDEAQSALHRLTIGAQEVTVSHEGESVTFRAANAPQLRAYIAQLRAALGLAALANPGMKSRRVSFSGLRRSGGLF